MESKKTVVEEFKEWLDTITKEEAQDILAESGIYDKGGNLTPEYDSEQLSIRGVGMTESDNVKRLRKIVGTMNEIMDMPATMMNLVTMGTLMERATIIVDLLETSEPPDELMSEIFAVLIKYPDWASPEQE